MKASILNCSFDLDPPINYAAVAFKQGLVDSDQRVSVKFLHITFIYEFKII